MEAYGKEVEKLVITTDNTRLIENTLGLVGEAGEVAEKVKKLVRDSTFIPRDVIKELGDVLWYIATLADELNLGLDYIAEKNILKLQSRKERNTLSGSGDDR